MDRWPYPFIEMNPDDMAELGLERRRSRRGLQRQRLDPGDGLSDADGEARSRPSCCSPTRPASQGNVVSKGVNEFIIPNYKQTWGDIRKISDARERRAPVLQVAGIQRLRIAPSNVRIASGGFGRPPLEGSAPMRKTNLALDCAEGDRLLPVDDAFAAIAGEATIVSGIERLPFERRRRTRSSRATLHATFRCRRSITPPSTATA